MTVSWDGKTFLLLLSLNDLSWWDDEHDELFEILSGRKNKNNFEGEPTPEKLIMLIMLIMSFLDYILNKRSKTPEVRIY